MTTLPRSAPGVRPWALYSAALGPVALVLGWVVAGLLQPATYSPLEQSISALAGHSANYRWIATSGIYAVSVCQILTAGGLSGVPRGARLFLAFGGVTGLGVAGFPQPSTGSTAASPHLVFATLTVISLACWPAIVCSRDWSGWAPLGVRTATVVTAVFVGLVGWIVVAGHGGGGLGVAERVDTAVANAWPVVVVIALRRAHARRTPASGVARRIGVDERAAPGRRWGRAPGGVMDPSVSPEVPTRTELDAVRIRRAELRETLNSLENTLAAPAAGRAVVWGEAVHAVLLTVAGDFGAHVEVTEGPHGLHQSILGGDLRLANAVEALTAEHAEIAEEIAMLVAESAAPVAPADVADLRERATRLLGHLVRHRQRGADLVYEAYQTDIGGGD